MGCGPGEVRIETETGELAQGGEEVVEEPADAQELDGGAHGEGAVEDVLGRPLVLPVAAKVKVVDGQDENVVHGEGLSLKPGDAPPAVDPGDGNFAGVEDLLDARRVELMDGIGDALDFELGREESADPVTALELCHLVNPLAGRRVGHCD